MDKLCIEIYENTDCGFFATTIESFLALYVYKYLDSPANIQLYCERKTTTTNAHNQLIRLHALPNCVDLDYLHQDLTLPVYVTQDNTSIAGMCAVCRQLIARQGNSQHHELLGFKSGCLQSSSEASIWTRFCEVDVTQALVRVQKQLHLEELPVEMVRLERHMNEPVRMHNIYKSTAQLEKNAICAPRETLDIAHSFVEGVTFSLADLILYPCVRLLLAHFCETHKHLPLTHAWLKTVSCQYAKCDDILDEMLQKQTTRGIVGYKVPDAPCTSLYKSDPKRYKPRDRIYTEQSTVALVINKLSCALDMEFTSDSHIVFDEPAINWQQLEADYEGTSPLPGKRIRRKHQQLENMVNAVKSVAKPSCRIVDFCSGTGHLGLLLALLLPDCTVSLVENKAFALNYAKVRAGKLGVKNCRFYQCNIDYFRGDFEVGVSLHACGSATDIVLQKCMRARAAFVSSPCCYGGLQAMPHLSYPLSREFRACLHKDEFTHIAHAADQAHELGTTNCSEELTRQGQLCMDIVDTDRMLYAQAAGYKVILTRFKPDNCTQKNHLIVGQLLC